MPRYVGTVAQSILDYYAAKALSAQQWFSQSAANYWGFTLRNNATDGTLLYVYDARSSGSSTAYPSGTGNPGGNPNPIVGPILTPGISGAYALISQHQDGNNDTTAFGIAWGGVAQAGDLLLMSVFTENFPLSALVPWDPGFTMICGVDGNAASPCASVWAKVAVGTEGTSSGFTLTGVGNGNYSSRGMRFAGGSLGGVIDSGAAQKSITNTNAPIAPAIAPSSNLDLLYCAWANTDYGQAITGPAGFTMFGNSTTYGPSFNDGYMVLPNTSAVGPFVASMPIAGPWSTLTATLKASVTSLEPGQVQQMPSQILTPQLPGLFLLNFSTDPLGLTGITTYVPPGKKFTWDREAPIAIVQPGSNYNLAGIAPEFAAWASMTWLAIK